MEQLHNRGVRAFQIQPHHSMQPSGQWLEPPGYRAMLATAARTGQALSCLIDLSGFSELDRMCRLYPDTKVIIDHLGRIGEDGMIRDADVQSLSALAAHRHVFINVGAFFSPLVRRPHLISTWGRSFTALFKRSEPGGACGKAIVPSRSWRTATWTASP